MASGKLGMYSPPATPEDHRQPVQGTTPTTASARCQAGRATRGGDGFIQRQGDAREDQGRAALARFKFDNPDRIAHDNQYDTDNKNRRPAEPNIWTGDAAKTRARRRQARQRRWTTSSRSPRRRSRSSSSRRAQQIYAVLDTAMSKVLTDQGANIDALLADAETQVNDPAQRRKHMLVARRCARPGHPPGPGGSGQPRRLRLHGRRIACSPCLLYRWCAGAAELQQVNFVTDRNGWGCTISPKLFADPLSDRVRNTLLFTGLALLLGYALPLLVAVLPTSCGTSGFSGGVYLPVMLPPIVTVLLWQYFYDPGNGLFNTVLRGLHLPESAWTQSPKTAMISLVLVSTWSNMAVPR